MKLVTYLSDKTKHPQPGALIGNRVIDIGAACIWAQNACGFSREDPPTSLLKLIQDGPEKWDYVRHALDEVNNAGILSASVQKQQPVSFNRKSVRLLSPIQPVSLRDAYAFEQHVRKANENRGREVPEEWYRFPVFYYTNHQAILDPDSILFCPRYTKALDYELEIAAVVGTGGKNLSTDNAENHIFGYTIFNDWSARDIQRIEMKAGLGPAKGKDFASSLGPCIITIDELADRATDRPGVYDLSMTAAVNGERRSAGNFKDIYWSFGEILARVSEEVRLHPGEVIGSGTVGTGCLLELTKGEGPWLQPGDVVELEIERIGILRNPIFQL